MAKGTVPGHEEDSPLHSSKQDLENYQEHPVWMDLDRTAGEMIQRAQNDLEKAETIEEVKEIQGEIKGIRNILKLPEIFKRELDHLSQQAEQTNEVN